MYLDYDARLIEEAVFHAQRRGGVIGDFEQSRSGIYEIEDAEERERKFQALNREWFDRRGLAAPIEHALGEQKIISARAAVCYIVRAVESKDEGAELFVAKDRVEDDRRTLSILLRPEALLKADTTLAFLRRELFHIADMLDPAFAYEPTLPKAEGGPTYDNLITTRYRVLWEISIHGRMLRRGWLAGTVRESQLALFLRAFPMLGEQSEAIFEKFFDNDRPTHVLFAGFAFDPRTASGLISKKTSPGTHCPLCRFPTHAFEAGAENLDIEVLTAIQRDFPTWTAADGLCAQCADLYRATRLSHQALSQLPGWR
jgi:hypothetical protein